MSNFLPRRGGVALVVVASGLAVALSGALVSGASAAPAATTSGTPSVASTVASSAAAAAPWFRDPRTPAQRKAQVRIPSQAKKYRGAKRETKAVYRTRGGALAVPASFAVGHQLTKGQAVTLDRGGLFHRGTAVPTQFGKTQLSRLARSLESATSIRCEGYADYSGSATTAKKRAKSRAVQVCARLKGAADQTNLRTKSVSYGSTRPAVVGGHSRDRRMNYRVVVTVTGTKPAQPTQPPRVTVPGAPRLDYAEGVRDGVSYGFAAPGTDGLSPVTGYEVSTGSGWSPVEPSRDKSGNGLIHGEITGLASGTTVTLQVRARNAAGAGAASATLSATAFGVPTAPTALAVIGDDGSITTTFGAPESDGGAAVESYEISYDGATTWTAADTSDAAPWTVTQSGFENGTTYDVRVRSSNRFGIGSAASHDVLVATVPGAPTLAVPVLDGATATLTFQAPGFDGGSPVTSYEATRDGGETWVPATATETEGGFSAEFSGFAAGSQYDVRVRAINERGAGSASNARQVSTQTVPDAPTDLVATPSGANVTLRFTTPASDGGSPITGYEVKVDDGSWAAATVTDGAIALTGQAHGTHVYAVRAVNAVGASASATSGDVEVLGLSPQAYRSEYYYSGGSLWTYVFFTTVPGAVGYEARLDGGEWLTMTIEANWITESMARVDDPGCGATACTGDRTIQVRAVFPDGYSDPGNSFPVMYFVAGRGAR